MLEYRYDTQLLIDGHDLDEDKIYDYFVDNFEGDCLIAVGDEEMIKIHYHTNQPWKVLEDWWDWTMVTAPITMPTREPYVSCSRGNYWL